MSDVSFDHADRENAAEIADYLWDVCMELLEDGDPVIDVLLAMVGVMRTLHDIEQAMDARRLN